MVAVKRFADRLDPAFVERMRKVPVPWGPIGFVTYKRTYARLREDLGRTEEWVDTTERGVNAILSYGGQFTHKEAETLFEYVHQLKCTPPGRMLWQLGTRTVERLGGDSLCNCYFVAVDSIDAFCFTFNELMLGGGVGFSVLPSQVYKLPQVRGPLTVSRRDGNDVDFIVPDNREGWVELLRRVMVSYFETGRGFTYSVHCVRGKGERIKSFGGIASGPKDLVDGITRICGVLDGRAGKHLRPIDALDLMNLIGSVVVSGNVRRSAQLALGAADDTDFLEAKRWSKGVPNWRAMSNNSVARDRFEGLGDSFWLGYEGDGEPYGLVNLGLMRAGGRLRDGAGYRPDPLVLGVNPCVPGDTRILTRDGYFPIREKVGQEAEVWNGEQWSTVTPRVTGRDQPLVKVSLSDGTELVCTPAHRWCVQEGQFSRGSKEVLVPAGDLQEGDRLCKFSFPVVEAGDPFPDAYTHGFYCGDGYDHDGHKYAMAYGDKKGLIASLSAKSVSAVYERGDRQQVRFEDSLPEKFVVPFGADIHGRLEWLAGLLDTDGCVVKNPKGVGLQISSVNKEFLLEVRLLLTTLGVAAKLNLMHEAGYRELPDGNGGSRPYWCQDCWRLLIGSVDAFNLLRLGLNCRRLSVPEVKPQRDAKRFVEVVSVEDAGYADAVYCFTEPKAHRGTFNGIVTGQCGEQSLEDEEACDLGELFLPRLRDRKEFVTAAKVMYKVCKTVLQLPFSWPGTEEVIRRNQRMGLSVSGFCQSAFGEDDYEAVYRAVEELDRKYSKRIGSNPSIKLTTVKPSGTVSLLPGVTPGVHPAYSRYYLRRIRFADNDPIVPVCRAAGYPVEPQIGFDGAVDHNTQIVSFPVDVGEGTLTASQVSAVDQLEKQQFLQRHWSDNNVSATVYYRDHELPEVKGWLSENYEKGVKSVSFLRHNEHGFKQAPYEEITREQYHEVAARTRPITALTESVQWDLVDSGECAGGACPVK